MGKNILASSSDSGDDDIYDLFFPTGKRGEIAVIVRAWSYLDDSADQQQQIVFLAAGFIANRKVWRKVAGQWRNKLRFHDIKYFKSSECSGANGPFHKFRQSMGVQEALKHCRMIREDLQTVITNCPGLIGFAHGINLKDFREVAETNAAKSHAEWEADYYLAGFKLAIGSIAREVMRHKHEVGFVCDDTNKKYKLQAAYEAFKEKYRDIGGHILGVTCLDDKKEPRLQMADLAADAAREVLQSWILSGEKRPCPQLPGVFVSIECWERDGMDKCLSGAASCP